MSKRNRITKFGKLLRLDFQTQFGICSAVVSTLSTKLRSAPCNFSTSLAVSYTHLDVYKRQAINSADPTDQTLNPRPYVGIQYVGIPEFQAIGTQVGQTIAAVLTGKMPLDQALKSAQAATARTMTQAGYGCLLYTSRCV